MLAKSLDSLLLKAVLNSTVVRDRLIEHLLVPADPTSEFMTMVVTDELRRNGDNRWRSNEYKRLAAGFDFNSTNPLQEWLRTLFSRYFRQDGMSLYAREECLEEYGAICRECHPFLLISARLGEDLRTGILSPQNAELISENLTENALHHQHNCIFAENHCHYGGATNNNVSLFALLYDQPCKKILSHFYRNDRQRMGFSSERDLFRLVFGHLGGMLLDQNGEPGLFQKQLRCIWDGQLPLNESTSGDLRWLQEECRFLNPNSPSQEVLCRMARQIKCGYLDSALLLFMIAAQSGSFNTFGMHLFWLFSLQLNRFRSDMVMSYGNGLSDFVQYYGSGLRKAGVHHGDAIRSIFMGGVNNVELRQAEIPKKETLLPIFCEQGKTLRKRHPEYGLGYTNELWQEFPHPAQGFLKFNFGYHFVKNGNALSVRDHVDYRKKYRDLDRETQKLLDFYRRSSNRIALTEFIPDKLIHVSRASEKYELDMRLLLRTLDAAGDENVFPPEVFAPFARRIRANSIDMQYDGQNKKGRRLRFAFHAGEDFTHIVTGMRRVYETVLFMEYERGDRLGHALAIGIDPATWMHKKREIIVPLLEYFDNCVWLWKMSIDMSPFYPEAIMWTEFYAQQARAYQQKLYPQTPEADLNDFWLAYSLLRDKHPDRLKIFDQKEQVIVYQDGECDRLKTCSSTVWNLHQRYLDLRSEKEESALLSVRDEHFFTSIAPSSEKIIASDNEMLFWLAVQDYLLCQCANHGFILEANPSSNVCISDFERYEEHPLFRWHPVRNTLLAPGEQYNRFGLRKGPVQVCVNSDDPGIFSTSLQNEFRLLQSVAQKKFTYDEAVHWVEELRQNGIKIFEENYISPYYFRN